MQDCQNSNMNLVSIELLSKKYADKVLFENLTFGIGDGEKTALIGINGSGKTTLLRIISEMETEDSGTVSRKKDLSISYLPQEISFDPADTVLTHILRDNSPRSKLLSRYETALSAYERTGEEKEHALFAAVSREMDTADGWAYEKEIETMLSKFGIPDRNKLMGELSGGQLKRVGIAQALLREADLLILDEPTNHLDVDVICQLEELLKKSKQAMLLVTHDRYFLDHVCNTILELYRKEVIRYACNYSRYLEKKTERMAIETQTMNRLDNILRNELTWLRRGCKARTTKQKARIDRVEELQENRPQAERTMSRFASAFSRLGKKIAVIEGAGKSYGPLTLFRNFSYSFKKGDRIGIIGPNGSGKSTLLGLLSGAVEPDRGTVEIGQNTRFGVFDQFCSGLNESMNVLDYLKEYAQLIKMNDSEISVSVLLERFLFPRDMFYSLISKLSGGEKKRLYLIRLLLEAPNFLIFDEPTNDFDIQTLVLLEDFLDEFPGCLLVVSHDRFFLDKTVDTLFILDGSGIIKSFPGNWTDYINRESPGAPESDSSGESPVKKNHPSATASEVQASVTKTPNAKSKMSNRERGEYNALEKEIEDLENEYAALSGYFSSGGNDAEKIRLNALRLKEIELRLPEAMKRWELLAQREV